MKRQRTRAQRRAAHRLARWGQSLRPRAAGDRGRRSRPPRDPSALLAPRLAAQFDGFGPPAAGWDAHLPNFDLLSPNFELPAMPLGPESLNER